mgnify:CR=1 FL=1
MSRAIVARPVNSITLNDELSPGYTFQCFTCDEDFYSFEQDI